VRVHRRVAPHPTSGGETLPTNHSFEFGNQNTNRFDEKFGSQIQQVIEDFDQGMSRMPKQNSDLV